MKVERKPPGTPLTSASASLLEAETLIELLRAAGKTPPGAVAVFLLCLAHMLVNRNDPVLTEEAIAAIPRQMRDLVAMLQEDQRKGLH